MLGLHQDALDEVTNMQRDTQGSCYIEFTLEA